MSDMYEMTHWVVYLRLNESGTNEAFITDPRFDFHDRQRKAVLHMKSRNDDNNDNVTMMFTDVHGCSYNVIICCMCVIDSGYVPVLYNPNMHFYFFV